MFRCLLTESASFPFSMASDLTPLGTKGILQACRHDPLIGTLSLHQVTQLSTHTLIHLLLPLFFPPNCQEAGCKNLNLLWGNYECFPQPAHVLQILVQTPLHVNTMPVWWVSNCVPAEDWVICLVTICASGSKKRMQWRERAGLGTRMEKQSSHLFLGGRQVARRRKKEPCGF